MKPAAVVKTLLYSDPHGFQKLKHNATYAAQCIFNTIIGSVLTITPQVDLQKNQKQQYLLKTRFKQ